MVIGGIDTGAPFPECRILQNNGEWEHGCLFSDRHSTKNDDLHSSATQLDPNNKAISHQYPSVDLSLFTTLVSKEQAIACGS